MSKSYIIDTTKSAAAKLVPLPVANVSFAPESFWAGYREGNRTISIPKLFELFEEKGILDNFRRLTGQKKCERRGPLFTDSDIYKWMEAAAFALTDQDDPDIRRQLETAITVILPAQCDDGYLNTFFTKPEERFTNPDAHEMYCAGHYFQAAIAIDRCLGDDRVLNSAIRFADYLYNRFGPDKKEVWACGHPEIEMALVELYRTTDDKKYLDFSRHILDQLNADASWKTAWSEDCTVKFTERTELWGHAVRNLYMACGGSDLWAETDDPQIAQAVNRLWQNLVNRRIYITGGVGSRYRHEAIGLDYELPNLLAYTETCAAIANVMWNYRNLHITADARFADWLERSLYNGVISGISLDYQHYFYVNPLASFGDHQRQKWFDTTCCPSNLQRLLAMLPGYFYSTDNEGVWVHLYDTGTAGITLKNGDQLTLTQQTKYPYDGLIVMTINTDKPETFNLNLRIPSWADSCDIKINGQAVGNSATPGQYFSINRTWTNGDRVELTLPMPLKFIACHSHVTDNFHRVAMMRGPLVYCIEDVDNKNLKSVHEVGIKNDFSILASQAVIIPTAKFDFTTLAVKSPAFEFQSEDALYRPVTKLEVKHRPTQIIAIPYYIWANRGRSEMTIWLPVIE
ncbi:MAG: glycoside hydrolase family 127 protein [Phycisphaerae bacterium]|jgi:DUF1680 family protein|nr:glycoside hydrolase family 127 protein [Phycisphaerae bacterium]